MMRKILLIPISIILIILLSQPVYATNTAQPEEPAADVAQIIEEQMNSEEMQTIKRELQKVLSESNIDMLKNKSADELFGDLMSGNSEIGFGEFVQGIIGIIFSEFERSFSLIIRAIVIVCLTTFLKGFQIENNKDSISEIAFYTCYALVLTIICTGFIDVIAVAKDAIQSMTRFIDYTSPALFVLMAASGKPVASAAIKPTFILAMQILSNIIVGFFLPLFLLVAVLMIVDNMSENIKVTNLADLLKSIINWSLGICMTIFIGLLTLQNIVTSEVDSVAGKTLKYATGNFVPVIGKYLADSIDTVVSCAAVIKNVAGVGVMIGVVAILISPILKIFTIAIMYKLTSAVIQPIADKKLCNVINGVADTMNHIAGIAVFAGVLVFVSISLIIKGYR